MTEYEKYRIKEADICDCKHVQGSHAGKYFALKMAFMAISCGIIVFFPSVLIDLKIMNEWESAITVGILGGVIIYLGMFVIDKGCSFCTCKKFKWSGRNEYD